MKKSIKIPFLLVILSFFFHLYLARQHYDLKYGFHETSSICTISDTFNCEAVTLSAYSYFLNIPMALWGTVFHLVFFVILSLTLIFPEKLFFYTLGFWFAVGSAVASTIMLLISILFMDTYCLFCILLYVLSYLNLAFFLFFKSGSRCFTQDNFKEKWLYILPLAIPVMAFLFHDMAIKSFGGRTQNYLQEYVGQWSRSSAHNFSEPLLTMGDPNSQFRVVEFADFQCIHCKNSSSKLHAFFLSHPDAHFSFYAFPLDGRCNPGATARDGKSCLLARAVFCSEKEGKGWEAHKWVFDRFNSPENSNFDQMAQDLKLTNSFGECLNSDEAIQFIEAQSLAGQKAHVEGTPSVFVNGKPLPSGHYIPVLEGLYKRLKSN